MFNELHLFSTMKTRESWDNEIWPNIKNFFYPDAEVKRYGSTSIEVADDVEVYDLFNDDVTQKCREYDVSVKLFDSKGSVVFEYYSNESDENAKTQITRLDRPKDYLRVDGWFFSFYYPRYLWIKEVAPALERKYDIYKNQANYTGSFPIVHASLKTTKTELIDFCKELGISFCWTTNASNRGPVKFFANSKDYVGFTSRFLNRSVNYQTVEVKCANCSKPVDAISKVCPRCGYKIIDEKEMKTADELIVRKGPSGGYIFFDKGEFSDGWRYLEAAPADLRVVNNSPSVDSSAQGYSSAPKKYVFGCYRNTGLGADLFVNGSNVFNESDCTKSEIGSGKNNTKLLVDSMNNSAYIGNEQKNPELCETTEQYAARLCLDLKYEHDGILFDDWFLPSKDELDLMLTGLFNADLISFYDCYNYWSSTEYHSERSSGATDAFLQNSDFEQISARRTLESGIRPIRAF